MNQIIFLLLIVIIAISLPFIFRIQSVEGYANFKLEQAMGDVPDSETNLLVQDIYPPTNTNTLSNDDANEIWWHQPVFKLGSYEQITNNIRYPNSPDDGTCMPPSMCGALYHEKEIGVNYIKPLPPVNPDCGTRIGYFTTNEQLVDSLPYRTNMQNILY